MLFQEEVLPNFFFYPVSIPCLESKIDTGENYLPVAAEKGRGGRDYRGSNPLYSKV